MTTPEHSPLPWHDNGFGIVDCNGKHVKIYGGLTSHSNELANRSLIIRAVSSHAALLAAAKEARNDVELRDGFLDTRIVLDAAIAAAEEQAP